MNAPAPQQTPRTPERLLVRVEEAARILGFGRSTIYVMMDKGELPFVKRGAARRIPIAALYSWVAANTQ